MMLTMEKLPTPGHALIEVPYVRRPIVAGKRGPDYVLTISNCLHKSNPGLSPKKKTSQKCHNLFKLAVQIRGDTFGLH